MRFDTYEQMIQAAVGGQGVAMGIGRLVQGLMAAGRLAAPFGESSEGARAYFIVRSAFTRERPHVQAFVDCLVMEARAALAVEDTAGVPAGR
jgi:DNA-binding transcriptional LysR family regulator